MSEFVVPLNIFYWEDNRIPFFN